jgi:hypothetical protein
MRGQCPEHGASDRWGEMVGWELVQSDAQALLNAGGFHSLLIGSDWRLVLALYIGVVITLLVLSTRIPLEDRLGLRVVFIAAFGWPLAVPVIIWKVWSKR